MSQPVCLCTQTAYTTIHAVRGMTHILLTARNEFMQFPNYCGVNRVCHAENTGKSSKKESMIQSKSGKSWPAGLIRHISIFKPE